jgi:hypothetical protein
MELEKDINEENEEKKPLGPVEELSDNMKEYLATRYELTVLKTSQKVSIVASAAAFGALVGLFILFFLLFILIACGFYLSDLFGNYGHGFAALSGVFLLLALIFYIGRKKLIMNPVRNVLIKAMFDED